MIVSGGQTGADRGALDAAIRAGVTHGGWCPRGRRAEDQRIPRRYRLWESRSRAYRERTERNVVFADGTVVFSRGPLNGGSLLTLRFARRYRRPVLHLDLSILSPGEARRVLARWLARYRIAVLNVAGQRESKAPGIAAEVRRIVLSAMGGRGPRSLRA